jgi:hypothetical protein
MNATFIGFMLYKPNESVALIELQFVCVVTEQRITVVLHPDMILMTLNVNTLNEVAVKNVKPRVTGIVHNGVEYVVASKRIVDSYGVVVPLTDKGLIEVNGITFPVYLHARSFLNAHFIYEIYRRIA